MKDQVPRLWEFQRQHPEVDIRSPGQMGGIVWVARDQDGNTLALGIDLRHLLDRLEEVVA